MDIVVVLLVLNLVAIVGGFLLIRGRVGSPGIIDTKQISDSQTALQQNLKDEMSRLSLLLSDSFRANRQEIGQSIKSVGDSLDKRMEGFAQGQTVNFSGFQQQLNAVSAGNNERLEKMRETIETRLQMIQHDTGVKLEKMRETVDEKLHATLEKRLGESFKLVSERLDLVHRGLGEMQTLASGVGDLKKVLQNVKTRGTWGEVQLSQLLEQVLHPEQYAANVATKAGSADRVEFAVKLPGKDDSGKVIWMPIDAKFPVEDYQRLIEASEAGDIGGIDASVKALETRIKSEAKDIKEKYLDPPHTTDFGILFLPIEGLYAEVVRRPGFVETLQREYRVIVSGPTTIWAILNSLQMGFRTLAIEKRSSEVWALLSAVKNDFGRFGDLLEKTHKKLQEASSTIEDAASKSRRIEQRLGKVQTFAVSSGESTKELPDAS